MTALVLCRGGSRGAVEVGLYRALVELRVPIDLVVGTSVGAINSAAVAARVPPDDPLDFSHTDELMEGGTPRPWPP